MLYSEPDWSMAAIAIGLALLAVFLVFLKWKIDNTERTVSDSTRNGAEEAERAARSRLQSLRENELSLGAHMRRGVLVATAPGRVAGIATEDAARGPSNKHAAPACAVAAEPTLQRNNADEGFALSTAIGAASGSTVLGYAVGGSLAGAVVGASIHRSLSHEVDSSSSSTRGGCSGHEPDQGPDIGE